MAQSRGNRRLGAGVDMSMKDALDRWFKQHGKGRSREVALSEGLSQVLITVSLGKKTNTTCWIEVSGKDPWEGETYGYAMKRHTLTTVEATIRRIL